MWSNRTRSVSRMSGMKDSASATPMPAIGTLIQKIQRQSK